MFDNYLSDTGIMRRLYSAATVGNAEKIDTVAQELSKYIELCKALDTVIEHSDDGIFICDSNCVAIGANRAYEIISGIPRNEIPGRPVAYLAKKYTTDAASLSVKDTLMPNTLQYDFCKTGKKALVSSNPIFDSAGRLKMIVSTIRDVTELEQLKENLSHTEQLALKYKEEVNLIKSQFNDPGDIIAEDENTLNLLYNANKIAKVNTDVLIYGETGAGKDTIAKFIYKNSNRSNKPFIKANCITTPENMIESEFFGCESGLTATGEAKIGLFEIADGGTIFIEEVSELSLDMQARLLRVLQNNEIVHAGGTTPVKVDVRVIAATNRNLKELVERRSFRQDLFYRLNVLPITVPPIRDRRNDIIPLVNHFLEEFNKSYQVNKSFTNSAYQVFMEYNWPGNVSEIKNAVERAVIISDSNLISAKELSLYNITTPMVDALSDGMDLKEFLERIEYDYINKTYEKFNSAQLAANYLHMSKPTFIRKRKQYSEKFSGADDNRYDK